MQDKERNLIERFLSRSGKTINIISGASILMGFVPGVVFTSWIFDKYLERDEATKVVFIVTSGILGGICLWVLTTFAIFIIAGMLYVKTHQVADDVEDICPEDEDETRL